MNKKAFRTACAVVLAVASIACLAGCPEHPGGGGTIQQQSEPQQGQNLPSKTVQGQPGK